MQSRARFERLAFVVLTSLAALVVLVLPVIPGHDIPQHLAYVRLIAAWQADPHALLDVYTPPDVSNVYSTAYRLLALIAGRTSPDFALRVALVTYVVGLAVSVRALVRTTWRITGGDEAPPVTSLLGPVVAFNPVFCMGLLAYILALAPFVAGAASAVSYLATGRRRSLTLTGLFAAVTAALHGVAAAALVGFIGLLFLFRRDRRSLAATLASASGMMVTSRVLGSVAQPSADLGAVLLRNMHEYGPIPGFIGTFRVTFTHWLEKLDQIMSNVLGPFPVREKIVSGLFVVAVAGIALWARRKFAARAPLAVSGVRGAWATFALLAIFAPAAVQVPDDLSLIDFRLITTATILGIAMIPPSALSWHRAPRFALAFSAGMMLVLWARQLAGNAGEVMQSVRLVNRLDRDDRLLALSMHDASAFLDERNEVLHYAAVHHTVRTTGVTSLFWGRFSPRLPVGYRPGREPPHPGDWSPWELEEEQIFSFSHVIVRWPAEDDDERQHWLASRIIALRDVGVLHTLACDGPCCLFEVVVP